MWPMDLLKTLALFVITAPAEIVGCCVPHLWLKQGKPAWLLSLHPTASGRVYAAYGGAYIMIAVLWLWAVDDVQPTASDWVGVAVSLGGMAIIMFGSRNAV